MITSTYFLNSAKNPCQFVIRVSLIKKKEKKYKIWILVTQSVHVLYQHITLITNKLLHLFTS